MGEKLNTLKMEFNEYAFMKSEKVQDFKVRLKLGMKLEKLKLAYLNLV